MEGWRHPIMNRLIIHFPEPTGSIEIRAIPKTKTAVTAMVRDKHVTLLKAADGSLYSPSFRHRPGLGILQWDEESSMRYLPLLFRLGCIPKGLIPKARAQIQEDQRRARYYHHQHNVVDSCRKLGIKAPRIPKYRAAKK